MSTLSEIQERNRVAIERRDAVWKINTRPAFGIGELAKMPPYLGFVEASVFSDLKFVMFLSNNDDGVTLRWLWNGYYEPMSLGLWAELARQSNVIFDIGAHTGVYTLTARHANRLATVVSCEPYHLNYSRLLVNLRANDLGCETAYPVAISDRDGVVRFGVYTDNLVSLYGRFSG